MAIYIALLYTYCEILTKDFSYANELWPIIGANDVSSRVRKMIRPITSHRGVRHSCQNSGLTYRRLQLAALSLCQSFADIQQEKVFSKSISRKKTEKNPGNWSGIVSCISLSMKRYAESQLSNSGKGKNRTRRKLKLCSLSELLCLIM